MNLRTSIHVGQKAIDLVAAFPVAFPNISFYYFMSYRPVPGVKDRLNVDDFSIQGLRRRYPNADTFVDEMLRHVNDDEKDAPIEVRADELLLQLPKLAATCNERQEALAVYSLCRDENGRKFHIPMMDFRLASGTDDGQLDLLQRAVKGVQQDRGIIVDSGNSYHFYGLRLLPEKQWRWFMAASVLLEPLVDVRYISHRLLVGKASLRLTTATGKDAEPLVVSCF